MSLPPQIEIVAQSAADARRAIAGGADRVELCQALAVGGLTPSIGLITATADAIGPERIAMLVRPRGGGFIYDDDEVAVVAADIRAAAAIGVGAFVVGALTADGRPDARAVQRWRDACGDATLVFHRAIDVLPDPARSVSDLVDLGVDRVLSSGGAAASGEGVATLARMVAEAAGRLEIMAGGGVTIAAIPALVGTGVQAVHLSARTTAGADAPAGPGGGVAGHDVVDPAVVAAAVAAARLD
ncbi:copper homeostasis protein CutC [Microbacterium gorillae]|uniref:copper homeostasis protein CutC n=1 Tax=Microbacterium gorillae TaxID=1231063 RepID=UPI000693305B|nr:copper homeostasis protein CutC [Microbacterium gorillae]